jgi:hypothetical protein
MKEADAKVQENMEFTRKTVEVLMAPGHGRSSGATTSLAEARGGFL